MSIIHPRSQRAWPYFCGTGAGAGEIRPAKKTMLFCSFSGKIVIKDEQQRAVLKVPAFLQYF